jgi:pilus assembly protein TadC
MLHSEQKHEPKDSAILKAKLKVAGINKTPKEYMSQTLRSALMIGVAMTVMMFFLTSKNGLPIILSLVIGVIFFFIGYITLLKAVDSKIRKRAKEIDKDVLFAGRFLLIKLNSGKPLVNSLMEASQSYGVANTFFKFIVRDIELGTPLEKALEQAVDSCPSQKMKRILFQINNALKIGIDITQNLEAVLEDIANEQLVEIQRYGKKLNSLTLFYMLLAVVVPSLGMTMFMIVAGLVSLNISITTFMVFAFFLLLIEIAFMTLFKSIRPNVNI